MVIAFNMSRYCTSVCNMPFFFTWTATICLQCQTLKKKNWLHHLCLCDFRCHFAMQKIVEAQTPMRRAHSDPPVQQHLVWPGQNCCPCTELREGQKIMMITFSSMVYCRLDRWRHISVLQAARICPWQTQNCDELIDSQRRMPGGRHRPPRHDHWFLYNNSN